MRLYLCRLTAHENIFYATREAGRLYETGRYLHNYALTYALGLATAPYFHAQQMPRYAEDLLPLAQRGIYVTPARGLDVRYEMVTFKLADNAYRVRMEQVRRNTPSFGRAKELAVGSTFEFAVLAPGLLPLPRWIRLGLWRSKALLECLGAGELTSAGRGEQVASLPLNPLDLSGRLLVHDLISMPPSSLVDNARLESDWLQADIGGRKLLVPAGMCYRFGGRG
ncbi:MAG: type I-D CRISPR-associated protein Cas5/Csc1 [Anaerolineae bacterium]